jgi:hypothetical protein
VITRTQLIPLRVIVGRPGTGGEGGYLLIAGSWLTTGAECSWWAR